MPRSRDCLLEAVRVFLDALDLRASCRDAVEQAQIDLALSGPALRVEAGALLGDALLAYAGACRRVGEAADTVVDITRELAM